MKKNSLQEVRETSIFTSREVWLKKHIVIKDYKHNPGLKLTKIKTKISLDLSKNNNKKKNKNQPTLT